MERTQGLLFSILLNIFFFVFVLFSFEPLLNSGDDAFIMYTFSGAFGVPPSELADYNYVWHFILGLSIKSLFHFFPAINWYTLFLITLHFASCTVIGYVFLRRFEMFTALLLHVVLLFFFESRFLLSLTFTNTAIVCALAGNTYLISRGLCSRISRYHLLFAVSFLFIAGLIRFHAWGLIEFLFIPFIFLINRRNAKIYLWSKLILFLSLFLFFLIHVQYYKSQVTGWQKQEDIKQALHGFFNSPKKSKEHVEFKNSIEKDFFYNGLFYDSSVLNYEQIKHIASNIVRHRDFSSKEDLDILYWHFIESRVYIYLFLAFGVAIFLLKQIDILKRFVPFLLFTLILYAYLFLFKKVTGYMLITFFLTNWLILCLVSSNFKLSPLYKKNPIIFCAFAASSFLLMSIRLYSLNESNIKGYKYWISLYNDLKNNSDKIHVEGDGSFPIAYCSVMDNPNDYRIDNFLSITHFPRMLYQEKKEQFGLTNVMMDLIERKNLVLIGRFLPSFEEYYKEKGVIVSEQKLLEYKALHAYRLIPMSNK